MICDRRRCCFRGREPSKVQNREASGEAGAGEGPGPSRGPWQEEEWARSVGLAVMLKGVCRWDCIWGRQEASGSI